MQVKVVVLRTDNDQRMQKELQMLANDGWLPRIWYTVTPGATLLHVVFYKENNPEQVV